MGHPSHFLPPYHDNHHSIPLMADYNTIIFRRRTAVLYFAKLPHRCPSSSHSRDRQRWFYAPFCFSVCNCMVSYFAARYARRMNTGMPDYAVTILLRWLLPIRTFRRGELRAQKWLGCIGVLGLLYGAAGDILLMRHTDMVKKNGGPQLVRTKSRLPGAESSTTAERPNGSAKRNKKHRFPVVSVLEPTCGAVSPQRSAVFASRISQISPSRRL